MLKRPFAQNINPSLAWKSFKTWDNIKQKWEAGNIRRKWKVFQPEREGWNLCGYAKFWRVNKVPYGLCENCDYKNLTPNITFKLGEFTKEGSIEIQPRMKMILTCNIFLNCLVRNRKLKVKLLK